MSAAINVTRAFSQFLGAAIQVNRLKGDREHKTIHVYVMPVIVKTRVKPPSGRYIRSESRGSEAHIDKVNHRKETCVESSAPTRIDH